MAHNIATIDGKAAMSYQGETPWHKLGTVLPDGVVSIADALAAASLTGQVALESLFLEDGTPVPMKRAVRRDDGEVLSVVSEWYQPIQYTDAFGAFQPAVEEFGLTVEAAGALGRGEKAWMLFRLPTVITPVPGDDVNGYGVAITGHDGKTIYEFRPTPVRVVCQNTLNAAVGAGGRKGRVFGISHVGNDVPRQVEAVKKLVVDVLKAMTATGETFAKMATRAMTPVEVVEFVEGVFPTPKDAKPGADLSAQLAEKRKTVASLIWTGVGADLAMSETGGKPNPWACMNAVAEYFDHVAPAQSARSEKARNASALFGSGADLKLLAFRQAERLVTV